MIKRLLDNLYLVYFKWESKKKDCHFSKSSSISSKDIFEGSNYISGRVIDSYVGYGTYISDRCFFRNCKIGRYCSIAPDVQILRGTHPTRGFVSTSPAFYLKESPIGKSYVEKDLYEPDKKCKKDPKYDVVIGNDVWIGQCVLIMQGVCIGDGAIIGAGAVVTKDVPDYAVVAGVPAQVKKYRFEKEQINSLQNFKWWERNEVWIEKHAHLFDDIERFLEHVENSEYMEKS